MRYLAAIDGLRAVAVLAVVAYHAGLPVPAGFVGVDVFFVISGYLITRLLAEEYALTRRIDFGAFYARRARRILPALAVVILATLGLASVLLGDASDVARSAAAASGFVANLWFLAHSGYWAPDADTMPLLHLWSLSVEEQFYLVWPLVLLLARRRPVAALATIAVASLALAEWWLYQNPDAAFYQMPARAWELAAGGLVALRPLRMPKGSAWAGLALVLASSFVPFTHFPGIGALPAVLGAGLLIAGVQAGQRVPVLETRPVVYVGLISYSLYLWHWPLLALARANGVGETPLGVRLGLVALAFVCAAASYRYVETPARRTRWPNRRVVASGLITLACLSGGAWALVRPPVADDRNAVPKSPRELLAEQAARDQPSRRCYYIERMQNGTLPRCTSDPGKPVRMAIWGDSYALAWMPFAWDLAKAQGVAATMYGRDACQPLIGYDFGAHKADDWCEQFNTTTLEQVAGLDTVILAGHWRPDQMPALRETVRHIRAKHVLVLGPIPYLPDTVPRCILAGDPCRLTRAEFDAQAAPIWFALKGMPVEVIDPAGFLCHPDCEGMRDGLPLYWDRNHISTRAAHAFAAQYLSNRAAAERQAVPR